MAEKLTEGWGVIRPGDRRAHYYRGRISLCGRIGFYRGPLEPDTGPSVDDCAACRKKLKPAYDQPDTVNMVYGDITQHQRPKV